MKSRLYNNELKIDTVFFDLFFTLINPQYSNSINEYDLLNISCEKWEQGAEDYGLYKRRAIGLDMDPLINIRKIVTLLDLDVSDEIIIKILRLREKRFYNALVNVDKSILDVLRGLKRLNIKTCIISNADITDIMFWNESPLSKLIDKAIFSCEVKSIKPDKRIYEIGLTIMNTSASKSLYVGDGGSNELEGAKNCGFCTVLTEQFMKRDSVDRSRVIKYTDYQVKSISEILKML